MEMQTTEGKTEDSKAEYYRLSGEKCFCHEYLSVCSCHCCVLLLMLCWTIFGLLRIWVASTVLVYIYDEEWYTSSCTVNDKFYDDCCVGDRRTWGSNDAISIGGVDCDLVEIAYIVSLVNNIC